MPHRSHLQTLTRRLGRHGVRLRPSCAGRALIETCNESGVSISLHVPWLLQWALVDFVESHTRSDPNVPGEFTLEVLYADLLQTALSGHVVTHAELQSLAAFIIGYFSARTRTGAMGRWMRRYDVVLLPL